MRNKSKDWSEDEYLLALDFYFKTTPKDHHKKNPQLIKLADLIHRTPSSIVYRLGNYASVDPSSTDPTPKNKAG